MLSVRYSCWILMKMEYFDRFSKIKYSNMKSHENSFIVSRAIPRGGKTDVTKLIVTFLNSAKTPRKWKTETYEVFMISSHGTN